MYISLSLYICVCLCVRRFVDIIESMARAIQQQPQQFSLGMDNDKKKVALSIE